MKSHSVSWKCCLAVVVLATSGAVGGRASADYISTLNTLAGPDRISLWRLGETSGSSAVDDWGAGTLDNANTGTYNGVVSGAAGPS